MVPSNRQRRVGGNYFETSGTAIFANAFAKGANKRYIPKKYKKKRRKPLMVRPYN
ncbi:glycoside hydrolase family 88 protein [Flavobacterium sp. RSSA_27]|uniref:glycoside hydrolase family 88 protein n=1 Tax=Flavobacterium sp. RSSA_27 TaxID=3447667 RepID=UPI003F329B5E